VLWKRLVSTVSKRLLAVPAALAALVLPAAAPAATPALPPVQVPSAVASTAALPLLAATRPSGAKRVSGRPAGRQLAAPRRSVVQRIVNRIPTGFLAALAAAMLAALGFALVWLRERRRAGRARRAALVDPLTGIANRLAFEQRLEHEWRRATRYERPLGLLLLDLDGLKLVNDTEGHAAGDEMLRAVGTTIASDIRDSDLPARLAGDEFVVLCPETADDGMKLLAAKLSKRLQARGIEVSIGRAQLDLEDAAPEDLVARADVAMYRQKERRQAIRSGAARRAARPTAPPDLAISSSPVPRAS
jgi:diguanylate cyclase (GGDEF)-like protein